jgi:hypothetical protein
MPITNYPSGFSDGVSVRGMPLLSQYSGQVFWVDDSGSNGNKGTFDRPFATIQKGIDSCTAGRGDMVMVKSGHAETVTAQIDADTAGVAVIGLGPVKPVITVNGAIDGIDVSAAGVSLVNLEFAIPGTDAQTSDINVDAAYCSIVNCTSHGSTTSKNKVSFITVTANGDDLDIVGFRGYNDTVDMVSGIELAAAARVNIVDCHLHSSGTVGYSTGVVDDTGVCTDLLIKDCTFKNVKAATAVLTFASNSVGVVSNCHVSGRHTTIASNILEGTGMDFFETYVTEEAALNGLLHPVADGD